MTLATPRIMLTKMVLAACLFATYSGCAYMGPLSPLAPLERSLIFYPAAYPHGDWNPMEFTAENAWFESADGTKLHGWFVPHEQPRATVLFLHGNAGNVTSRAEMMQTLNERHNLSVMVFDYRSFGRSEKKRLSERAILKDARAARAWLAKRTGVPEQDIVLMGRSLGGGVAVDLAAKDGARGLVLASTFTSLPDVGADLLPWVPTKLLMTIQLNSLKKIKNYYGPLLQSHGDADQVVPFTLGKRLFDAAPGEKQFVKIADGGHNDPWNETFHVALEKFIVTLP